MEANPYQVIPKGDQCQLFEQVVSLALVEPRQHLGQLLPCPDSAAVQLLKFMFALARLGLDKEAPLRLATAAQPWLERVKAGGGMVLYPLNRHHPQKRGRLHDGRRQRHARGLVQVAKAGLGRRGKTQAHVVQQVR
ncbi:hypothetical protein D3C84_679420 [compost metagenome]